MEQRGVEANVSAGGCVHSSDSENEEEQRIPRLSPDWNWQSASITPAEGYLLSRIDGSTPIAALRQIGGMTPSEIDQILEGWAKEGWVIIDVPELPSQRAAPDAPATQSEALPVDSSLDLSIELQHHIFEYETKLDAGYHEILGVERACEPREIKRAYFRLSKEFHPDRYFRRNVGDFGPRLERIFKKVAEAYELLSDPTTRKEIEMSLGPEPASAVPDEGSYAKAGGSKETIGPDPKHRTKQVRVPTRMENLARLRSRFKMPKKLRIERQFKAKQFQQTALVAVHEKRWLEAAASMRLAIAFDPWKREYKSAFAEIQADVHRIRAEELIAQSAETGADPADALKLLEEALHYRPADIAANVRAAQLSLELKEYDKGLEFADNLCQLDPDVPLHHVLVARAHRRSNRQKEARDALEKAATLNASDPDVQAERLQQRRKEMRR